MYSFVRLPIFTEAPSFEQHAPSAVSLHDLVKTNEFVCKKTAIHPTTLTKVSVRTRERKKGRKKERKREKERNKPHL